MQPETYSKSVRDELLAAAALGDERTQTIAQALARTVESAVRLAVIDAVSAAARELNLLLFGDTDPVADDAPTGIRTSVDADGVRFSVVDPAVAPESGSRFDDGEPNARISLRLTEALKADIERAAAEDNISVNNWLVRAATVAVDRGPHRQRWAGASGRGAHRISGWVTG